MPASHMSSTVTELPKPDVTGDVSVNLTRLGNMKPKNSKGGTSPANDTQSLMDAVIHGDLAALRALFESGHSINQQDAEGRTPLAIACYQGWYDGSLFLLSNGADQMIADKKKRLPLHAATYDSKIRCLALLVQNMQANELNIPDEESMLALHWAAYHDRPEHVQLLISKRGNMFAADCDGKTPLHWASQRGNAKCVEILLREARGTNLVNVKDGSGKGAIHYAAAAGHYTTIECLSKSRSCNVRLQDPQDRQPLHWAAAMGRVECVELLLTLGADPNMHDLDGRNALYYAKQACHDECAAVLGETMKRLRLAKREELMLLSKIGNKHKEIQNGEQEADDINNSSPTVNSSVVSTSTPSVSSNKLPPIRGTNGMAKSSPVKTKTDDKLANAAKSGSQVKSAEHDTSKKAEKPVNKAMKFAPTTRLYPQSSEENED